jgi:hypothetical protein
MTNPSSIQDPRDVQTAADFTAALDHLGGRSLRDPEKELAELRVADIKGRVLGAHLPTIRRRRQPVVARSAK